MEGQGRTGTKVPAPKQGDVQMEAAWDVAGPWRWWGVGWMQHWLDEGSEEDYPPTWEGLYTVVEDTQS